MKLGPNLAKGTLATSLLLAGCGSFDNFENLEGDIVAGEPVEVLETWHNKRKTLKHGPSGYVLYLVTEDCESGLKPAGGPEIAEGCDTQKHTVTPQTYKDYDNGDTIYWEDEDGPSEVVEHRYGRKYYYATVYDLGLLVEQCVRTPGTELGQTCVKDFVEVNVDTWYNANPGDTITFAGDEGEVVSG